MPNWIHALGRGIARFVAARVPENPRTAGSFNVGEIEGGTSGEFDSIPSASMKVDLRSESEQLNSSSLESFLRDAVQTGIDEEMSAAFARGMAGSTSLLDLKINVLGVRPGGRVARQFAVALSLAGGGQRKLGNRSRRERSSTDANIPLSVGIQGDFLRSRAGAVAGPIASTNGTIRRAANFGL